MTTLTLPDARCSILQEDRQLFYKILNVCSNQQTCRPLIWLLADWVTQMSQLPSLWHKVEASEVSGYDSSEFYGQGIEFIATRQMWLAHVYGNGAALSRLWWTLVPVFYGWWFAVNPLCVYILELCECAIMCIIFLSSLQFDRSPLHQGLSSD